jgi:hypothetical protein
MKLGASPQYSLYAAAYNRDTDAIRLLVRYGADIEEASGPGDTPFLGAIAWSHFETSPDAGRRHDCGPQQMSAETAPAVR